MTIRSSFASFGAPLAVAIALMATPASVNAAPVKTIEFEGSIAYDDLDLAKPGDVTRLHERVRTTVGRVCASRGRDSVSVRHERECRETALATTAPAVRMAVAKARADRAQLAQNKATKPNVTPGA